MEQRVGREVQVGVAEGRYEDPVPQIFEGDVADILGERLTDEGDPVPVHDEDAGLARGRCAGISRANGALVPVAHGPLRRYIT